MEQSDHPTTLPGAARPIAAASAANGEISRLTEHLFRHEAAKMVSVLTGIFGIERLSLAEDVVQEALVRAFQSWPYYGIPKNPAAWLMQTAKNLTLDVLRRENLFRDKLEQIVPVIEQWGSGDGRAHESPEAESGIADGILRLMFACCHPLLPEEAQAALALKTLCGFGTSEIASAFLAKEAAIAKRLTRARQRIRELRIGFEIPTGPELEPRIDSVLRTLYLLFNEGYKASAGEELVRKNLCSEAVRLTSLLVRHPAGDRPATHALLALMLLNSARLDSRVDAQGNLLRLAEQDRNCWDKGMISRGMLHLAHSAAGQEVTVYHLQAAIAACHCAASDYTRTDWPRIVSLYEQLASLEDSPIVALNHAVAVAQVEGPRAGLDALNAIKGRRALLSYCLFHAVKAEFESQLGNFESAARNFAEALRLTNLKSEQAFLSSKLADCVARAAANAPDRARHAPCAVTP